MPRARKNTPPALPIDLSSIGTRISAFRKSKGLTQTELAEIIGISRKLVTDYETGTSHLNDDMVIRFSLALGVSSDELLGLKDTPMPKSTGLPLRYTRRMKEIDNLPESKKKAILNVIDDLIRANS